MVDIPALLDDLAAEQAELVELVAGLTDEQWRTDTPAPGWTIAHQIAHLAYFDEAAVISMTDPERFADIRRQSEEVPDFGEVILVPLVAMPPQDLLAHWKSASADFAEAAVKVPPGERVAWFGPAMSLASKITARLMETWAHAQDVADALGVRRTPTDRLRHVAMISFKARPYSYLNRGLDIPTSEIAVELIGPSGDRWVFGPTEAPQRIRGTAEDFCLVLTRRRHVDDTSLEVTGADAAEWLQIGQAFAGDPGPGREPGQFTDSA